MLGLFDFIEALADIFEQFAVLAQDAVIVATIRESEQIAVAVLSSWGWAAVC